MSIWNYRYMEGDLIDLNRCLSRSGIDWRINIQETLKRHFLNKSSGMFKYRDVVFELWNFGEGWRGQIVDNASSISKTVALCMDNNNGRNRWDYSKCHPDEAFLKMINDLITNIDELAREELRDCGDDIE